MHSIAQHVCFICVCAGVSCVREHANVNTIYFERKEIKWLSDSIKISILHFKLEEKKQQQKNASNRKMCI